jgi:hypothetical protein
MGTRLRGNVLVMHQKYQDMIGFLRLGHCVHYPGCQKDRASHCNKNSHRVVFPAVLFFLKQGTQNQDRDHLATLSQSLCGKSDKFEGLILAERGSKIASRYVAIVLKGCNRMQWFSVEFDEQ